MKRALPLASLVVLATSTWASAAVLMEERFDGSGYTVGNSLAGKSGGTGFNGSWSIPDLSFIPGVPPPGTAVISSGLALSSYPVSGNALTITETSNPGTGRATAATRTIGSGSTVSTGGDLWISYLYQYVSGGSAGDDARVSIRASNGSNDRFVLTGRDDALEMNGGVGIDSSDEGGTFNIQNGAVYLLIAHFTNVNNGANGGQTGTFWALNATSYDAVKTAGFSVANLNALAYSQGADNPVSSNIGFSAGEIVALVSTIGGSSAGFSYKMDELRYATDLASVVMIPEPTSALLALSGAVAFLGMRRRRTAVVA